MRETWLSKERKREQWGRLNYQRKEKESNEGDLIVKAHALSLSLSHLHTLHPAEREGAQKTSFHKNIEKIDFASFQFFWWFLPKLVSLNI